MKCVCGYEYVRCCLGDEEEDKGDEEFILLNVVITRSREYAPDRTVRAHACPKCSTVRIDQQ